MTAYTARPPALLQTTTTTYTPWSRALLQTTTAAYTPGPHALIPNHHNRLHTMPTCVDPEHATLGLASDFLVDATALLQCKRVLLRLNTTRAANVPPNQGILGQFKHHTI